MGLAAVEIIGGLQWAALSGDMTLGAVFGIFPGCFIPKDIVITVIAVVISGPSGNDCKGI